LLEVVSLHCRAIEAQTCGTSTYNTIRSIAGSSSPASSVVATGGPPGRELLADSNRSAIVSKSCRIWVINPKPFPTIGKDVA
jgi:hypothetical protein